MAVKREVLVLCEVLHRTTRAVADLVDEYDVDDDAVHALTSNLEDLAEEYLQLPRSSMALTGRDALQRLLEELEERSGSGEDTRN